MIEVVHPALIFFVGALVVGLLRGRARSAVSLLVPLVGCACLLGIEPGDHGHYGLFDHDLCALRLDELSRLFAILFHLAAFIGVLFAWHVRDAMQQVSALVYAGAAIGAVLAGDLVTLFIAWELLAVTSVFLVWAARTEAAVRAGVRYLLWNVLSGVVLLAGILIVSRETGSMDFGPMELSGLGTVLLLLGIGIKCGFPLLHTWILDAYPASTATGTVFLSAFTTKTAVYALARGFPGAEPLIWIGVTMTAFPIFYAVVENDLRRVLCYSMVNQIGFMVVGIGLGTELALNGAVSHAFADVLFKGLLFMSMGAVLLRTGTVRGTELGGLHKTMPKTTALCIVGALSISAFPLFSAFITKSMVMAAALEQGHEFVWFVLLFASAGVLEHAGIKIPYFAFFAHDSGIRTKEPPWNMLLAMAISAGLCIAMGSFPSLLYSLLPYPVDYAPYSATHVVTQCQILLLAAVAVHVLIRSGIYPPETRGINLDAEWFHRRAGRALCRLVGGVALGVHARFTGLGRAAAEAVVLAVRRAHGGHGVFSVAHPIGVSALLAALMLGLYLLLLEL